MKHFSSTIKIGLALLVGIFSNGLLPTMVSAATPPEETNSAITEVVAPVLPEESVTPTEPVTTEPGQELAETDTNPTVLSAPVSGESATFVRISPLTLDTLVTPTEPTIKDICGGAGDDYTIPTIEGVEYWRGNTKLTNGSTHNTGGDTSITITAKAKNGYVFADGKKSISWKLVFDDKCTICHRTASAGNPYIEISVSVSAINGIGNGDHYKEHTGPVFPETGTDGKWGDIIPALPGEGGHDGLNWVAGQAIYNNHCVVPVELEVTPGPCAYMGDESSWVKINLSGSAKNTTLLVKDSLGNIVKEWDIKTNNEGEITSPSLPVTLDGLGAGDYTVEVVLKKEVIASSEFTIDLCYRPAYPKEPKKLDMCYGDKDKIYIAKKTEGVIYKVNGVEMSGWVHYEGETLVVTAEAKAGFEIDSETTSSWTFDSSDFSNQDCLTITKTGVVASDTNHDGVIGVGDTVTWEITVTNTSDSKYENFYVTIDDETVTLQDDGYIGYLGAGEHATLTATSIVTVNDLKVCKATNTATFSAWRASRIRDDIETSRYVQTFDGESDPLATGSATAIYTLVCPTPGSGGGTSTTTTPQIIATSQKLPETIPSTGTSSNLLLILTASLTAYGATFFLQQRRNLFATNQNR